MKSVIQRRMEAYREARYSSTKWLATAPSLAAVMTCRSALVRTSPIAKTPGSEVLVVSSGGDVSMIQIQLSFKQSGVGQLTDRDKDAVARDFLQLTAEFIAQPQTGNLLIVQNGVDRAVPDEFQIIAALQRIEINPVGPQRVAPVNQDHLFANP